MAGDSSRKKWWKRLGAGGRHSADSKSQDGAAQHVTALEHVATASSADPSTGNTVLVPKQGGLSSTTVSLPLRPSADASIPTPPGVSPTSSGTALSVPQTKNGDGTPEILQMVVGSLWDRAYDLLRDEEPDRVAAYESLLSEVLARAQSDLLPAPSQITDLGKPANSIPQDPVARREKLRQITELGLEHMKQNQINMTVLGHEIVLQDLVADVAGVVKWAEDWVKGAVKDLPYASAVMAGVSLVLPLLTNPPKNEAANQEGFTYVTSQMRYYVAMESLLLPEDMKPDLKADLANRLVDLYKLIIDFQVQTVIRFYRSRTKNFFRGTVNYDDWETKYQSIKDGDKELVSKLEIALSGTSLEKLKRLAREAEHSRKTLDNLLTKVEELVGVAQDQRDIAQKMERRMSDAETRACLEALQASDPRDDKDRIESAKGGLLKSSYNWVLSHDNFQQWRDGSDGPLLWIRGDPGKGKTMLLCGIIDELKATAPTANISFFFCQATDARINTATAVLRGLVYMLVSQQPQLVSHLRESYDGFGKQRFEGPNSWVALSKILTSMLDDSCLRSTYVVIDALDECTQDLGLLLDFIALRSSASSSTVKWLVSSRNWPSIEKELDIATQKVNLRLELNESSISDAVTTYVRSKVEVLAKRNRYSDDTRDAVERHLSANAHGTFLWVALVCQELVTTPKWKVPNKLAAFPPGLDALYRQMMDQICSSDDAPLCKSILAVVSAVHRPITLDELAALVEELDDANLSGDYEALAEMVGLCGSFLTLREHTISFVHQSSKDFLLKQAHDKIFSTRIEDTHRTIFSQSLRAMRTTLRRDIYNLGAPGFPIDKVRPPDPDPLAAVRYSCVYWINHLRDCDPKKNAGEDLRGGGLIDTFLREKYLNWLEALSLQGAISKGVAAMLDLEAFFVAEKAASPLADRVRDACRFILEYKWPIENSPLQVYASALIFSPTQSITKKQFKHEEPDWIIRQPPLADTWSACVQTLEGHRDDVSSLAWSPDATRLASTSDDHTIKIWDPIIGECICTLEGHTSLVKSVAWLQDTTRLASASCDKTIKIWDLGTSKCVLTLEGHNDSVDSVAWLRDTTRLVSVSMFEVKIWDLATAQCVSTSETLRLRLHMDPIQITVSNSVLSDANLLATTFDPAITRAAETMSYEFETRTHAVEKWDPTIGEWVSRLELEHAYATSIAWSHDAAQLASGSDDEIKIWDLAGDECVSTLEISKDFRGDVTSMAWSPDATQLASAVANNVMIWDLATGQCISTLEGHNYPVTAVAWSYNATRLASASEDMTVKIWDLTSRQCVPTLEAARPSLHTVSWSHDATQFATAVDSLVNVWDPVTGQGMPCEFGHQSDIVSMAWSYDATLLAAAAEDGTVKIWDLQTGQCLATLEVESRRVYTLPLAWSDDATQLASAWDSVKVWDMATGQCVSTLNAQGMFSSVAWSSDTTRLAAATSRQAVKVWDIATGQCVLTLEGHRAEIRSLAWSCNSTWLASAENDKRVKIWDPETGHCVWTLEIDHKFRFLKSHRSNPNLLHIGPSTFDLSALAISTTVPVPTGPSRSSPVAVGFGLSLDYTWITYRGENLLWLPVGYRPDSAVVFESTLSILSPVGRFLVFELAERGSIL